MTIQWLTGLLRTRPAVFIGTAGAVALTVMLIAALGSFLIASAATMTERSAMGVPVDWQVELQPGADGDAVRSAIGEAAHAVKITRVGYASVDGMEATTGSTVQTTGPGKVLGVPPGYFEAYPGNLRVLLGRPDGVLIAQQTAANLHVAPGDQVVLRRPGLADASVTVDGVVDLPNADMLFQAVGVPPGVAPQAPPDNVLVLPWDSWSFLFGDQAKVRPDSVREQFHVLLDRSTLPSSPEAAYQKVTGAGHDLELRVAGGALLANNLAAMLDAVRSDAIYAAILFLLLGAPGAVAAILLTRTVANTAAGKRRRDQSLIRLRGGSVGQLLWYVGAEAAAIGVAGSLAGVLAAVLLSRASFGAPPPGWGTAIWLAVAFAAGLLLAVAAILVPAWRDARSQSIATTHKAAWAEAKPLWARLYLDFALLLFGVAILLRSAAGGYQLVLAPEGVAAVAVDYLAFLVPLCLWVGGGLAIVRLSMACLRYGPTLLASMLRPVAGLLAPLVAASLSRQRERLTAGLVLMTVAFAFGTSTSIFDATYQAQARVDAELTNGSDVTVTGSTANPAGPLLAQLGALPGVLAAQPMMHRSAYVGADLQDLYGIDPASIGEAATMADAYFNSGDAAATLALLAKTPDGILVSAETVTDFQLSPGDTINLRLQSAADHQYHAVPFRFVGVAREFPTAPRNSFLVANSDYVAQQTGSPAAEVVLLRAGGDPGAVLVAARQVIGQRPGIAAREVGEARRLIGSSLTAIDLGALTRLELGYAILLAVAASGLVLVLGILDRRRTFAVMLALGAKPRQLAAFIWSEGVLVLLGGAVLGVTAGSVLAQILVKLLTGVFDPPPEHLTVPWLYVGFLGVSAAVAVAAGIVAATAMVMTGTLSRLREGA